MSIVRNRSSESVSKWGRGDHEGGVAEAEQNQSKSLIVDQMLQLCGIIEAINTLTSCNEHSTVCL
jgi:hypothetical protein